MPAARLCWQEGAASWDADPGHQLGDSKDGIRTRPCPCSAYPTLSEGVSLAVVPLRMSRWHVRAVEFYSYFTLVEHYSRQEAILQLSI